MQRAIVIKGHLVGPKSVELEEPVLNAMNEVDVIVRTGERTTVDSNQSAAEFLRRLPAGTRSRDEIDRQIHKEREAWKE